MRRSGGVRRPRAARSGDPGSDSGMIGCMAETHDAFPADLTISLAWRLDDWGMLIGVLRARNMAGDPVRLARKPDLQPLGGADGSPVGADCIVTAEMRRPGYVDLPPGCEAVNSVCWAGWDGPPANGEWVIVLPGGASRGWATGPLQPERLGPATNLTSTWWKAWAAD